MDENNSNSDHDEVEVTGTSGRKRKSKVWDHFTIYDGGERAKYNHYGSKFIAKGSFDTSNYKRHLNKCHRLQNHDTLQLLMSNSEKLGARKMKSIERS